MAVSWRQRVILMAWRARGKFRWLTWAVFRGRVSARPCPLSRAARRAGTCRHGRALIWACSSGWFRFTIAMYSAFFPVTSQFRFARTVWTASVVTTASARSTGSGSSVKWLARCA